MEISMELLQNIKIKLPYDLAIHFGHISKGMQVRI
jgi:hypothetical protein